MELYICSATSDMYGYPFASPASGTRNKIALTWNGSVVGVYFNNVAAKYSQTVVPTPAYPLAIGYDPYNQAFFRNGPVIAAGVWSRALAAAEVALLFARPYCMFEAGEPFAVDARARQAIDGSLFRYVASGSNRMRQLGNIAAGQTLTFLFSTNDADGAAVAPSTAGTVSVYKDDNPTQTRRT